MTKCIQCQRPIVEGKGIPIHKGGMVPVGWACSKACAKLVRGAGLPERQADKPDSAQMELGR